MQLLMKLPSESPGYFGKLTGREPRAGGRASTRSCEDASKRLLVRYPKTSALEQAIRVDQAILSFR